jgi:hypothetical protein
MEGRQTKMYGEQLGVKKPRLFYFDDPVNGYIPVADNEVQGIIDLDHFDKDGEEREVIFKRIDMTDAEFKNISET